MEVSFVSPTKNPRNWLANQARRNGVLSQSLNIDLYINGIGPANAVIVCNDTISLITLCQDAYPPSHYVKMHIYMRHMLIGLRRMKGVVQGA